MDLSRPLAAVVPSLDGPVLQAVASTMAPLTGRQVHRIAGVGSEAGVRKVLARLVGQGLVRVTEAGPSLLYTANRDHLAWPAVETLTSIRRRLLGQLVELIAGWDPAPRHLSLFGSAARGDGGVDSDIDLLLLRPDAVAEDCEPWAGQVDRLRERVQAWTGNHCQVFQLDTARLAQHVAAGDPLIDTWRRDAVTVTGDDPGTLVREVDRPRRRARVAR